MSADSYSVRAASFEDAATIFDLIRRHSVELLPRAIADIVQNIDRFVAGEVAGRIAGTVSWQVLPEIGLANDHAVELKSLVVEEAHRGIGLGSALTLAALERIKELNPSQVIVLTFCPDFFRKFGFAEVPKEKLMHKLYMGCVNCTKYDSPFTCPEVAMALRLRG